jgi:hypothetical protein
MQAKCDWLPCSKSFLIGGPQMMNHVFDLFIATNKLFKIWILPVIKIAGQSFSEYLNVVSLGISSSHLLGR